MLGPSHIEASSMSLNESQIKKSPFFNSYTITKDVLGSGVSGKVVKCCDESGKQFALKVLKDTPKARQEIHLHWSSCSCSHIVNIVDVFQNVHYGQPSLLVVMELMEGELFQKIITHKSFDEEKSAKIIKDICAAVKYLHDRNIAHRDLKTENVLYKQCGDSEILKLTDFGFAKLCLSSSALRSPYYTPYYVAPEILGPERYGKSCDIWSLGVILYILLSGHPPFYSYNDGNISPGMKLRIRSGRYDFGHPNWAGVSEAAKKLIQGCLQIDVQKRFTIDQVLNHEWIKGKQLEVEKCSSGDMNEELDESLTLDCQDEFTPTNSGKKLKIGNSALMKRRLMKAFGQVNNQMPEAT